MTRFWRYFSKKNARVPDWLKRVVRVILYYIKMRSIVKKEHTNFHTYIENKQTRVCMHNNREY